MVMPAVELNRAGVRILIHQRAEQGSLSGTVQSDERCDAPAGDARSDAAQDLRASELHPEIAQRDKRTRRWQQCHFSFSLSAWRFARIFLSYQSRVRSSGFTVSSVSISTNSASFSPFTSSSFFSDSPEVLVEYCDSTAMMRVGLV